MATVPNLRSLLPAAAAGLALSLLSLLPAGAHGLAGGDLASGASHPLLGLDHLLMLVALGVTAVRRDASVLGFAAAGALVGAAAAGAGAGLPAAETFAALGVSAVAGLALLGGRTLTGGISAAALAVHALLHAQEAPAQAALGWWLGAGLASSAVVAATMLLFSRLPQRASRLLAAGLVLGGGLLALAQPG